MKTLDTKKGKQMFRKITVLTTIYLFLSISVNAKTTLSNKIPSQSSNRKTERNVELEIGYSLYNLKNKIIPFTKAKGMSLRIGKMFDLGKNFFTTTSLVGNYNSINTEGIQKSSDYGTKGKSYDVGFSQRIGRSFVVKNIKIRI